MAARAPIDLLRTLAAGLRANNLDREIALSVAQRLDSYFARAHEGQTLNDVFELAVSPGGESWAVTAQRNRRDECLRSVDKIILGPEFPLHQRASTLRAELRRYEAVWHRTDRHRNGVMPAGYAGTEREYLFAAFEANRQQRSVAESGRNSRPSCTFPMGESTLRKILSYCSAERTQTLK